MYLQFPKTPERLTPAEQRILEFIEGNREEFLFMSIGQAADRLEISEATISRFARHMGCQDFKELKMLLSDRITWKARRASWQVRCCQRNLFRHYLICRSSRSVCRKLWNAWTDRSLKKPWKLS